ncbi:MAG: MTH1187 family thiamine-binding protein [Candidatus Nezhaarchaeales archaeon]
MTVVAEVKVIPVGVGVSTSPLVAEAVRAIMEAGLRARPTPMCTVFEARSAEEALRAALRAHEAVLRAGAVRVLTTVTIDERRDVEHTMDSKLASLEAKLKPR